MGRGVGEGWIKHDDLGARVFHLTPFWKVVGKLNIKERDLH